MANRGNLPEEVVAERLLLAIYAYGTNTGIRVVVGGTDRHSEDEIRYARRRYLSAEEGVAGYFSGWGWSRRARRNEGDVSTGSVLCSVGT